MRSISIISKLTGVTNNVESSEITLNAPSIVELRAERADIASIARTNQDMVITLRDGEVITVKNFYAFANQGGNQLVLEDSKGALWWVQDTDSAFHFENIANIDELMAATGAESHGGGAIWPWVLGGVAVAGGLPLLLAEAAEVVAGATTLTATVALVHQTLHRQRLTPPHPQHRQI
ncbi:BapA/Bap/LapF family prefix-like domain-containing protein [Buttiauxella agrestis]